MDAGTLHQAKQIITEEVERAGYRVVKIILFGSRARGEARSDRQWFLKAGSDLKTARDELATEEPVADAVCFQAQQYAEKCLKAFLIFHGKEYPKTHDIAWLVRLCTEVDAEFRQLIDWGADQLTKYATVARYDMSFFPSMEEARNATALAERVAGFVLQKLRQQGFEP